MWGRNQIHILETVWKVRLLVCIAVSVDYARRDERESRQVARLLMACIKTKCVSYCGKSDFV